ncbi:MAG: hypothetical protein Q9N68_02715 [Gammaproteobacteria bacterium]|nr:hypothetical protein [Gammaproteobacteria bacterium]
MTRRVTVFLLLFCFSLPSLAVSFSADALQSAPQGEQVYGKLYMADGKIRFELVQNKQRLIQISNPALGKSWIVDPALKIYWLQGESIRAPTAQSNTINMKSFCAKKGRRCKLLGSEKISGRKAQKWQVLSGDKEKEERSLIWVDKKASLPLKQQLADGSSSSLVLEGERVINGRKSEEWQYHSIDADGHQHVVSQWYDPLIKMAIREEYPGGFVRELRNIVLADQDASLFLPPEGYREVSISEGTSLKKSR